MKPIKKWQKTKKKTEGLWGKEFPTLPSLYFPWMICKLLSGCFMLYWFSAATSSCFLSSLASLIYRPPHKSPQNHSAVPTTTRSRRWKLSGCQVLPFAFASVRSLDGLELSSIKHGVICYQILLLGTVASALWGHDCDELRHYLLKLASNVHRVYEAPNVEGRLDSVMHVIYLGNGLVNLVLISFISISFGASKDHSPYVQKGWIRIGQWGRSWPLQISSRVP